MGSILDNIVVLEDIERELKISRNTLRQWIRLRKVKSTKIPEKYIKKINSRITIFDKEIISFISEAI